MVCVTRNSNVPSKANLPPKVNHRKGQRDKSAATVGVTSWGRHNFESAPRENHPHHQRRRRQIQEGWQLHFCAIVETTWLYSRRGQNRVCQTHRVMIVNRSGSCSCHWGGSRIQFNATEDIINWKTNFCLAVNFEGLLKAVECKRFMNNREVKKANVCGVVTL